MKIVGSGWSEEVSDIDDNDMFEEFVRIPMERPFRSPDTGMIHTHRAVPRDSKEARIYEASLVAEEPNPDHGVHPIEITPNN